MSTSHPASCVPHLLAGVPFFFKQPVVSVSFHLGSPNLRATLPLNRKLLLLPLPQYLPPHQYRKLAALFRLHHHLRWESLLVLPIKVEAN